jgi:hypothetical protein
MGKRRLGLESEDIFGKAGWNARPGGIRNFCSFS